MPPVRSHLRAVVHHLALSVGFPLVTGVKQSLRNMDNILLITSVFKVLFPGAAVGAVYSPSSIRAKEISYVCVSRAAVVL